MGTLAPGGHADSCDHRLQFSSRAFRHVDWYIKESQMLVGQVGLLNIDLKERDNVASCSISMYPVR